MDWQPIETAPKDGTEVLLYVVHPGDGYARASGQPEGWKRINIGHFHGEWQHETAGDPTHWMPLPPPPASA